MKPEFSEYCYEQLLEERLFVSWILKGENNDEWLRFIELNPEIKFQVKKAKKIINLLEEHHKLLDENSVIKIWNSIKEFENQSNNRYRKLKIRRTLSWAASFLIIILTGIFGYFYFINSEKTYHFASSDLTQYSGGSLKLSTGEEILLNKDNSVISLDNINNQVAVNDTVFSLIQKSESDSKKVQMNEVTVPYGKKSEILLSDGTKVWLNAGSKLAFPSQFNQGKREVFLEGEACFQVAKKEQQPFIVNTENIKVKVLGTYFNVSAYTSDETVETVLIEGSIAIEKASTLGFSKKEIILAPNHKASYKKRDNDIIVSSEKDVDLYIAWTYGWLKYEKENLSSVLKKVERYYNVEIELPPGYPEDDKISGKLDLKESLEDVMLILADTGGFEFRITNNKVLVEKKMGELKRRF